MTGVLVVGDVIDDIHVGLEHPFRVDTDTEATIRRTRGGSAANTAVWLASTGTPVTFVGRVGAEDEARVLADFDAASVQAHLQLDSTRPTGTIVIVVHQETRTMLSDRGANVALEWDAIPDALVNKAGLVHLTGYGVFHHASPQSVTAFIERAKRLGSTVTLDASSAGFLEDFGPTRFLEVIQGVDVLRCNRDEGLVLTSETSIENAGVRLARNFASVIITDGSRGAHVFTSDSHTLIPAAPHGDIVDPTGAGDAFNAGVLRGFSLGESLEDAASRGAALAAHAVMTVGARP